MYNNQIDHFENSPFLIFPYNSFEEGIEDFDENDNLEDQDLDFNSKEGFPFISDKSTFWKEKKEVTNHPKKPEKYNIIRNKEEKIFSISKLNNKRGRLSNDLKNKNLITPHDKFSQDNIIRKIKNRFLKSLMNFINKEYSSYLISQKKEVKELIFPIKTSVSKNIKKLDNLAWFGQKIKDVYSCEISKKYKIYEKNENIKRIHKFYEEESSNQIKLIKILEMKIEDIYNIYISDEKVVGFETFDNLKSDMKKLEDKMAGSDKEEIKNYFNEYEKNAKGLKKIMEDKRNRINN